MRKVSITTCTKTCTKMISPTFSTGGGMTA
jgi:hypothetical protein